MPCNSVECNVRIPVFYLTALIVTSRESEANKCKPVCQVQNKTIEGKNMAGAKKRLQKELCELLRKPPPGMHIDKNSNLTKWIIELEGAKGTLYEQEKFQLQFKFGSRYPFDSPEVMFVGNNVPVHPHIYSNGHICLSILTEDWSPALSVESVCLSIVSMLSSCKEKKRPPDNSIYVSTCNKNPKKTRWWYHDDHV